MSRIVVNIIDRFRKPKQFTDLVILKDARNYIAEYDSAKYLNACKKYAKEFGVYLIPSRFAVNGYIYMCMFSPEGEIIGIQGATHLNLNYKSAFKQFDTINVIDTPLGKFFLCVDVDIYHPEVIAIAKDQGCEVVVASQYINTYEYNNNMITKGVWNSAQMANVFVVGINNISCAFAGPCDATRNKTGYVFEPSIDKNISFKIFTKKLTKPMDLDYITNKKNREFYKNHYKQLITG